MLARLRLVRRARELVEVVRDLRRVERAAAVSESRPMQTIQAPSIAATGEREHAQTLVLGG
ncbi:MAG: hypothetical protein JWP01_1532 [Myxococcales bacterium]|nr:hypothetical protein [Myxococcales bacterium]